MPWRLVRRHIAAILGWFFANNHACPVVREKDRSNYQVFFDIGIMPERYREAFLKPLESPWLDMLVVTIVISNMVTAIVVMSCFRGSCGDLFAYRPDSAK